MGNTGAGNVLIVDDEPNAVKVLSAILSTEGYNIYKSLNVERALKIINSSRMDAVITDLRMPDTDGMQLFEYLKEHHPDIPVIFLTAYGTVESAVNSITRGAFYYFIKPPDYMKLKGVVSRAVEKRRTGFSMAAIPANEDGVFNESDCRITGGNIEIKKIFETIRAVRDTCSSVLVNGETGTGKELIAKALHLTSRKKDKPFVAVNCAAIPRELMESELFGYEKGAFTSAVSRRVGRFEQAAGGTIFLDEIGELELSLQAKLLRVLQEREVERLGSNRRIKVDFRLVSSTNRDLEKEVEAGTFRKDLFYRINVVQINVPPLRNRKDDIPSLVDIFLKEFCEREKKQVSVPEDIMKLLIEYQWPGNIRQLKNMVERAVVLAKSGEVSREDLPGDILLPPQSEKKPVLVPKANPQPQTLRELESNAVLNALDECRGNKSKAAKMLGISRKTFYKRLKEIS